LAGSSNSGQSTKHRPHLYAGGRQVHDRAAPRSTAELGLHRFRQRDRTPRRLLDPIEAQVIAELAGRRRSVLATGGGVVLREANRRVLHGQCVVVYLRSTPEDLFRRLRHDGKRPLLQVQDPLARLRELHAVRDPLYRETSHFNIETGRPSVPTLVNTILMQLELAGIIDPVNAPSPIDNSSQSGPRSG
jgi:shikimate kinase